MSGGEPATPRRLQRAREEGDLPLAHGLTQAASLTALLAAAPVAADAVEREVSGLIARLATLGSAIPTETLAVDLARSLSNVVLPLLVVGGAAALVFGAAQTGGLFSLRLLVPRTQRFAPKPWLEAQAVLHKIGLALVGAAAVTIGAGALMASHTRSLANTLWQVDATLSFVAQVGWWLLWIVAAISLTLGAAEWVLARGRWLGRHRMTRQEILRERREQYGPDELRERRAQAHREQLALADLGRIDEATLLLYDRAGAAALSYDLKHPSRAPRVLFVARGELAAQALARARALGVPRRDVAELPRVWYSAAPNSEIERTHYAMVAERIRSVVEAKELPQPELTRPELTRP